ncbi:MAG TPA: cbb3-type cytochrome oxidase assembly protein CcoS [Armatimonadota bacterium]|nr:cbb3-type cytochrome oxidase assembly protein CcoS [Armatimonadota bacterium]
MWTTGLLLAVALILTAAAIGIFVWAARAGQFEDVEEAKFTMLRSEEDR